MRCDHPTNSKHGGVCIYYKDSLLMKITDIPYSQECIVFIWLVVTSWYKFLDTSSSCIDLFFTSQPKLIMDSGVHTSLHVNCHHQIIYVNFNFRYISHHPMKELSGIISMQTRIISEKLFAGLGWLAYLVSQFACNTREGDSWCESTGLPCQTDVTKLWIKSSSKRTKINIASSISQMVLR